MAAEKEMAAQLEQMKSLAVNANLHARVELIEEFKASQQADWDRNYKIGVWQERELKLTGKVTEKEVVPL